MHTRPSGQAYQRTEMVPLQPAVRVIPDAEYGEVRLYRSILASWLVCLSPWLASHS